MQYMMDDAAATFRVTPFSFAEEFAWKEFIPSAYQGVQFSHYTQQCREARFPFYDSLRTSYSDVSTALMVDIKSLTTA